MNPERTGTTLLWVNHFAVAPEDGGATRHYEVGRELARRGWRVHIAASDFHLHRRAYTRRDGEADRDPVTESRDGVHLHWLWAAAYRSNNWRRAWNWLSFSRSLLRWGRGATVPDVVIGSSPHLFAALAARRLAKRWGVPFVLEVRDLWPENLAAMGRRKGPAYHLLDRIAWSLYRRSERIVVLARGSGRYLAERGVEPSKIVYVPNGVDAAAFAAVERPERNGERFTAVYAGAHGPANGLDLVLDAATRLRDDPRIRFLLVGDGPSKPELVADARRRRLTNVEFRDPVAKDSIPRLLAGADAGLMVLKDTPLFRFGVSPNKLFDYLAAELPVVCNVPGEVAEMLERAGAGEQAEAGSAPSLAAAVRRMADRPRAERRALGRAGREWVAREHGRPVLARRLDQALRPLL